MKSSKRSSIWAGLALWWMALIVAPVSASAQTLPNLGGGQTVNVGQEVHLGDATTASNSVGLAYYWSFLFRPAGSSAEFANHTSATPVFVADAPGTYIISALVGSDGNNMLSASVSVTAFAAPLTTIFDHGAVTPACAGCHDGVQAAGKSGRHLAGLTTNDSCESCHGIATWAPVTFVDHSSLPAACDSCHNGSGALAAVGKSATHIATVAQCSACHVTTSWIVLSPAPAFDHNTATGVFCALCHKDQRPAGHPSTTSVCEACHSPVNWLAVRIDHTQVFGDCVSCHNNSTASGKTANHPATSSVCAACHSTLAWLPTNVPFAHDQAMGPCSVCHNNIIATGKPIVHLPTLDNCEACHASNAWLPATFDHAASIAVACVSCHNNVVGTGIPPTHLATTTSCGACHSTLVWIPVTTFDHRQVLGVCSSCHNGVVARGKPSKHPKTKAECNTCHTVSSWAKTKRR